MYIRSSYTKFALLYLLCVSGVYAQAQTSGDTAKKAVVLDELVVTATRTEKSIGDIPVPIQVISRKFIQQSGAQRITDILQQQTGLVIAENPLGQALQGYPNPFGSGIQLQGFDPAYTLILIDGEPMTGRNAGVLNLGRIPVANIRQIEIIKGPATSLYGSDALAGVINIITEKPQSNTTDLQLYHATNQTLGITGMASRVVKGGGLTVFANRFSSGGYDLDKNIYGQTVDPSASYAFSAKLQLALSAKTSIQSSVRLFTQNQRNNYLVYAAGAPEAVRGNSRETDWSIFNQVSYQPNASVKLTARVYVTGYENNSSVFLDKDKSLFDRSFLRQFLLKPELQAEIGKKVNNRWMIGVGYNYETINADRYAAAQNLNAAYGFIQKEWWIANRLNITAGARADKNTLFAWQINPKLAMAYKWSSRLQVNASVGTGFKAPDFRQQFLSFNNSLVGYTLLGVNELANGLVQLQRQGQIDANTNISPYLNVPRLIPEKSVGLNLGLRYTTSRLQASVNVFRNDVRNLIERFNLPFTKTNGQAIFSYVNLNQVFTQGADINIQYQFNKVWSFTTGYQFLDARDKSVLRQIKEESLYKRDPVTFVTTLVTRQDYGGLFNRSRHTANAQLSYTSPKHRWNANVRAVYRSRFGFSDRNGNAILDDDREYADGYAMVYFTAEKAICDGLSLQAGCENLLNYTDPVHLPSLPGRLLFATCNINIEQLFKHYKKSTPK